jgi:hypothetical protein
MSFSLIMAGLAYVAVDPIDWTDRGAEDKVIVISL